MGYYVMHATCGNDTEGDQIVKCGKCGHVSCNRCARNDGWFMDKLVCPACGNPWYGGDYENVVLGEIRPLNRD